ncbi:unnamed protein product [Aphanomyces euteiches]|uniref:Pentacotripeptide-repeat region of PRORP domain-containing protein n=1 Tax=Aphanomyces euteiches TaxID=100861 RepID=A0A6G0XF73_9STRA|nr:hypothetical protein Ae201684_005438 [Aphanomyces euteiches]KAH9140033.1 hypothetical protein AeRB84_015710 [Aphanomyces euteiches]
MQRSAAVLRRLGRTSNLLARSLRTQGSTTAPRRAGLEWATTRRAFSGCGPKDPADKPLPPVADDAFSFEECRAFLDVENPTEIEKQNARQLVLDVLESPALQSIMGIQATALMLVAEKLKDHEFTIQVYKALRSKKVQSSPTTLSVAAEACASTKGTWETALDVVEQMHEAVHLMPVSVDIYENAIASCAMSGRWINGLNLLDSMAQFNVYPGSDTWKTLVKTCLTKNEQTAAMTVVSKLQGIADDIDFDVDHVLEELLLVAIETHKGNFAGSLLDAMASQQSARNASWFSLRSTKTVELETLTSEQQLALVDELAADFNWLALDTWLPSLGFPEYKPLRGATSGRKTDFKRALHIYSILPSPSALFCNALLLCCGRHGLLHEVRGILASHPRPDITSYYAAIRACRSSVNDAYEFYEEAASRAQPPLHSHPKQAYTAKDLEIALLNSLQRARRFNDILVRVEQMESSHDAQILGAVLHAHTGLENWNQVVETFKEIKVAGFECTPYVYSDAMIAYVNLDQARTALVLYAHLESFDRRLMKHPAVVEAAFYALRSSEDNISAIMSLFRSLDFSAELSPLNAAGAAHLLLAVATTPSQSDRRACLEEIWPVLQNVDSLFVNSMGLHTHVFDAALLVAAKAGAIDVVEDIIAFGQVKNLPLTGASYSNIMLVYAMPPLHPNGSWSWEKPPEYPNRFQYWWDAMQEAGVKPSYETVTALLAAIRNGIEIGMTANHVLWAMENEWNVQLVAIHCEILFHIWHQELKLIVDKDQATEDQTVVAQNALDLIERMAGDEVENLNPRAVFLAAKCGRHAALALGKPATAWLRPLVSVAVHRTHNVDELLQALKYSSEILLALELLEEIGVRHVSMNSMRHALLTCRRDDTPRGMQRLCEYVRKNGNIQLDGATLANLEKNLARWGEDPRQEPWRSTLFGSLD